MIQAILREIKEKIWVAEDNRGRCNNSSRREVGGNKVVV